MSTPGQQDRSPAPSREGEAAPPRQVGPLTRSDFVQWVGAVADYRSPLHYDDASARAAGFKSVFSPGMLQAGILSDFATDWLGAENLRRLSVRFGDVVWPGDRLTCSGSIVEDRRDGARRRLEVELACTRGGEDEPVLSGSATFEIDTGEAADG